jgi:hypothetical protein
MSGSILTGKVNSKVKTVDQKRAALYLSQAIEKCFLTLPNTAFVQTLVG